MSPPTLTKERCVKHRADPTNNVAGCGHNGNLTPTAGIATDYELNGRGSIPGGDT
jgi:hypothetical protein